MAYNLLGFSNCLINEIVIIEIEMQNTILGAFENAMLKS